MSERDWADTKAWELVLDGCRDQTGEEMRASIATALREAARVPEVKWLVYSREHNLWWRANRCGYTDDMALAGRYTEAEAKAIAADDGKRMHSEPWNTGPAEFAVPDPDSITTAPGIYPPVPDGHVRTADGVDRKIVTQSTNGNGPIYGTAMMLGETVMVLAPATSAAARGVGQ